MLLFLILRAAQGSNGGIHDYFSEDSSKAEALISIQELNREDLHNWKHYINQ